MRRFSGVHIEYEPADRSVGIMGETFAAWPEFADGKNEGPLCELTNYMTWEFRWEDSETGKECSRPWYADLVEKTLRAFVEAFYADEREAIGA